MAERAEVLGLKVLFEGQNPCVDIIAVHGLSASPDWAWIRKAEDGNGEANVNWLADENMLPAKLPSSRIMTFNYESKWLLEAPKQRRSLCAIQLLNALDNKREEERDTKHRPLIFIGHSFGGIVIEQSLVSANSHGGRFEYLASSTVGIIFLGTPHRGTQAGKWGEFVAVSGKVLGFGSEDSILKDLREDSETLRDLLYDFTLWANRALVKIVCFFEQHETDFGKRVGVTWKKLFVDETSACIDGHRKVPLPTDHLKINKHSGPNDPSYVAVYPLIVDMAQQAVQIVQGRLNPQTLVEDNSMTPKENLSCLKSLFLSNPRDDLAAIRSAKGDRVDGTCEWILTQDRYTSWLNEDSPQLLWLSGGPGIGKTMISSFLVQELAHLAERSPQMKLAYYFCDDKDEGRRTATAILRGLLVQLLRQRPSLFKHIQSDFEISSDRLVTNFHALWRNLVEIVKDPEAGEVCCLIDALDECEKDSRQLFLTELTKLFCSQQSKKICVKFVVTSRREIDIEESLSVGSPAIGNLQIDSGRVNGDLAKFIDAKVDELSTRKGYSAILKETIKRALTEKAEGTFLYVSLVLDDLNRTKGQSLVRKKLQELPLDLNKLYDKILSQIEVQYVEIVYSILQWVTVARRPLTAKELAMARFVDSRNREENAALSDDLLNEFKEDFRCCGPLVYFNTTDDTVNLVHQSAKEYLLGEYLQANNDLSRYHVVLDRTNLLIFRTCWTYLSREEFKQGTMVIDRGADRKLNRKRFQEEYFYNHYFLRYARQEWLKHALAASPVLTNDYDFRKETLDRSPTLRDYWLLDAAMEGQEVVVNRLLEEGAELDARDRSGLTPLFWAAMKGHEAVATLLLEKGAKLEARDGSGQTPLSWAAHMGHTAVVKLLLEKGAKLEARGRSGRTPLSWAARMGHTAVVKLLLEKGVELEARDKFGGTPVSWAARMGYTAVVKLLLEKNAELETQDEMSETPLSWAVRRGHIAVVMLLLEKGAKLEFHQDEMGQTPLFEAARMGHTAIVALLLEKGAERNTRDKLGQTALSVARKNGHKAVIKLLEEHILVNI